MNMKPIKHLICAKHLLFAYVRPNSHYSTYHKGVFNKSKQYYENQFKNNQVTLKNFTTFSSINKDKKNSINGEEEFVFDDPYTTFTNRLFRHPGIFHNVLVIQPRNKSKTKWEMNEECERKLAEAVALIDTLRQWRVVEQHVIGSPYLASKLMFGSGNLDKIKEMIQKNVNISAVFIGVDIMTALQNSSLEEYFGLPVFDRYQIILQIFHDHAHTKEAKLQLALAEIPYIRVKLAGFSHTWDSTNFSGIHHVGGDGETFMEKRRRLLQDRELKIKKALEKVKYQREILRNTERRTKLPLIAVVGYTNCGKTTLIKALTNDERLLPENKLFATLDVTLHVGRLPSTQQVLFIDTVGFISNVPTALIQSFKSTLEEITLADLVVHVRDISHPDAENQKDTVLKTLEELDLPDKLLNSILEVRNKVDLLDSPPSDCDSESLYISATEGDGLIQLQELMEEKLLQNTDRSVTLIRAPNGGEEHRWLMKEGTIRDAIVDMENQNFLILEVILTSANLAKFKHKFGDMSVSLEDIR